MFYLVLSNIKKLILNRKTIFLIIFLSLSISVFGSLFFCGYFTYSYYNIAGETAFTVNVQISDNNTSKEIAGLISNIRSIEGELITLEVSDKNKSENESIVGRYSTKDKTILGRYFNENEYNSSVMLTEEVLAENIKLSSSPLSQKISIDDKEYTIIGILLASNSKFVLPVDYYIDKYSVQSICMEYGNNLNSKALSDMLASNKVVSSFSIEKTNLALFSIDFLPSLFQIILIFSFAFINVMMVISLWQRYCTNQYSIYYILGFCKRKLFILIFLQISVVALLCVFTGFIIYIPFIGVFESLGVVLTSVKDCLVFSAILFFIICIYAVVISANKVKKLQIYRIEE